MTEYLTPKQAATILGVKADTVRQWIRGGRLPADSWLGYYRLIAADVTALCAQRTVMAGRCRNGHDITGDGARNQRGHCRQCINAAARRAYLRRNGHPEAGLFLAERCPAVFGELQSQTKHLSTWDRLAAALTFWRAA